MHPITVDDIVCSIGRIKCIQNGRPRFIEFGMAKVIDVGGGGITVNPIGKNAMIACRPEDLELVEPADHHLDQTPASQESAKETAEQMKVQPAPEPAFQTGGIVPPTGTIAVTGEVAEQEKPKDLKALREKKQAEGKPKPKPRRRRR